VAAKATSSGQALALLLDFKYIFSGAEKNERALLRQGLFYDLKK